MMASSLLPGAFWPRIGGLCFGSGQDVMKVRMMAKSFGVLIETVAICALVFFILGTAMVE